MEITSVNTARVTVFFRGGTEITIGRVPIQAATKLLCERYGFIQSPKTLEDWQKQEGAIFAYGQHNGVVITRMTIYARGIAVDTQTSTDDCDKIIQDALSAANTTLGISISRPLTRKLYLSELTFVSDASLNAIHPSLASLAKKVGPFVESFIPGVKYEVTGVHLNVDETNLKYSGGPFRIERRSGIPFNENTYFSSAPMPTGEHAKALQDLEASLLKEQREGKA